jgi:hypothetical protein
MVFKLILTLFISLRYIVTGFRNFNPMILIMQFHIYIYIYIKPLYCPLWSIILCAIFNNFISINENFNIPLTLSIIKSQVSA